MNCYEWSRLNGVFQSPAQGLWGLGGYFGGSPHRHAGTEVCPWRILLPGWTDSDEGLGGQGSAPLETTDALLQAGARPLLHQCCPGMHFTMWWVVKYILYYTVVYTLWCFHWMFSVGFFFPVILKGCIPLGFLRLVCMMKLKKWQKR